MLYNLFKITLPNPKEKQFEEMATHFKVLTTDFLQEARETPEDSAVHQSILGVMLKAENENANVHLSLPEITAQVRCFIPHRRRCSINILYRLVVLSWPGMKLQQLP
ncbi:hypothetical protein APHAL10511_000473 [Amanita phalloides]|nr:hypothetical protein APHAL10511_000473 [Amanita phalloides]